MSNRDCSIMPAVMYCLEEVSCVPFSPSTCWFLLTFISKFA